MVRIPKTGISNMVPIPQNMEKHSTLSIAATEYIEKIRQSLADFIETKEYNRGSGLRV